jgi:hypothetical protein
MDGSILHRFKDDAKKSSKDPNQPPNCIRASDLDKNFQACYPLEKSTGSNLPYKAITGESGWRLEGVALFDVCENGVATQYRFFAERV